MDNEQEDIRERIRKRREASYESSGRYLAVFFSFLLLGYGALGLANNEIALPGRRSDGIIVTGREAIIMFTAFLLLSIYMCKSIFIYFDKGKHSAYYKPVFTMILIAAMTLIPLSIILQGLKPVEISEEQYRKIYEVMKANEIVIDSTKGDSPQ